MKRLYEKEMPLLSRKRIAFEIEHAGKSTPPREQIKKEVSKALNIKPELIAIRHIYSRFGANKIKVICHVYEDEKMLQFFDPLKKKEKKEAPKQEEKPVEVTA